MDEKEIKDINEIEDLQLEVVTAEEEEAALVTETEEEQQASSKEQLLNSLFEEDEEKVPELRRVGDVVKALSINGTWFRKQIGVILLIVAGISWNITNRYQAQQEMIEEEKLQNELKDWKYRCIIRQGELTLKSRQSQLEKQLKALGDSTLLPCNEALYQLTSEE